MFNMQLIFWKLLRRSGQCQMTSTLLRSICRSYSLIQTLTYIPETLKSHVFFIVGVIFFFLSLNDQAYLTIFYIPTVIILFFAQSKVFQQIDRTRHYLSIWRILYLLIFIIIRFFLYKCFKTYLFIFKVK